MNDVLDLSIVVITMNRRDQLLDALQSCMESKLPKKTEFIIIDNHSTDGTGEAIRDFFKGKEATYTYKFMQENRGVGGGRNEGFNTAKGKYVYFLDDDAVISDESKGSFFVDSIAIFKKNSSVATITTRVWDEMLGYDRPVIASRVNKVSGYDTISMFLGTSNFIRTSAFPKPLYPDFKYAFEEIIPSYLTIDKGMCNVYFPEVAIEHRPKVNKWRKGSDIAKDIICRENAGLLASKYLLYPSLFKPLIYAAFMARWFVHLRKHKGALQASLKIFKDQTTGIQIQKIKYKTVFKIFREFGFGAGV
ncbi:glycosyltransferase family 2 protein [Paenibacillus oceani]|uniref:Glycosyltransferase family 2 protein n=1 Tax=Paenibacillus oceani TaxID=2772510 RepID=A0A927CIU3_9BACL|nr:glycosyltransferase family 2 protein [Paenibacillus oceani]MBD2866500.1 glycosyltransferase family 2 protein [Paenibacillus oceani]